MRARTDRDRGLPSAGNPLPPSPEGEAGEAVTAAEEGVGTATGAVAEVRPAGGVAAVLAGRLDAGMGVAGGMVAVGYISPRKSVDVVRKRGRRGAVSHHACVVQ